MSKYNFFVKYDLILFTNGGFYILQMCLAESGLSYPCHRLTVGRRSSPAQTREQSEEVSMFASFSSNITSVLHSPAHFLFSFICHSKE